MKNQDYFKMIEKLKELQEISKQGDIPIISVFGGIKDKEGEDLPTGMLANASPLDMIGMVSIVIKQMTTRLDDDGDVNQYLDVMLKVIKKSVLEMLGKADFVDAAKYMEAKEKVPSIPNSDERYDEFDNDEFEKDDLKSLFKNGKKIIN